jgi:hypothetical protein
MALDLHSKVTIQEVIETELTRDLVLIRVSYKVKRGRKLYRLWALPRDLKECGLFPLCYTKDGRVLTYDNKVIYTGTVANCKKFVKIANTDHYTKS